MINNPKLDLCTDILSEAQYEYIVLQILKASKSDWNPLKEVKISIQHSDISFKDVYVCWLEPVKPEPGFV